MAALIQKTSAAVTGVSSISPTLNSVATGSMLILCLALGPNDATGNAAPSAPITQGQQWSLAIGPASVGTNTIDATQAAIYYLLNALPGTHNLTLNVPASSRVSYSFCEMEVCTALDQTASNSGTTSVTGGDSGTTATLATTNTLLIAALSMDATVGLANAGISDPATAGYTSIAVAQDTTTHEGAQFSYREVTTTAGKIANWTWTTGADSAWMGVIAAFKISDILMGQAIL